MKDLPNIKALLSEKLQPAKDVKPTTAAEARDQFLAFIMAKPEAERDIILYTADKLLDAVMAKPHMLNAFALANAELAALHEEGLLATNVIVPT